jgi:hypothetical protein
MGVLTNEYRDRAESLSGGKINEETQAVLEFMQSNIPVSRIIAVAETLPQMAKLLWAMHPQEPVVTASFVADQPMVADPL